jgi:competence protein ComEC
LLASFAWRGAHACERGQQWRWDGVDFAVLYPATTDQPDQPDRADAADRADGADPGDPAAHAVGTRSWSAQPHDRNNHACVLRISAGAHAVLLPADIEAPAERDLVRLSAQSAQLRSELVVVPHHGSRTSSTEAFIAAIGARWAVISLGWHNHYHHPDAAAVGRWAAAGASVVRTDQRGAVRITLAVAGISVEDARTARPAYWRDQTQF